MGSDHCPVELKIDVTRANGSSGGEGGRAKDKGQTAKAKAGNEDEKKALKQKRQTKAAAAEPDQAHGEEEVKEEKPEKA